MKKLLFDCRMGAAGDMITAALIDLTDDPYKTLEELNALGIPDVEYKLEVMTKKDITGFHLSVVAKGEIEGSASHSQYHDEEGNHHHHQHHRKLEDVLEIIKGLNASDKVKDDATKIYKIIADAESKAHGVNVAEVHFHEVGMLDAIADVTAACYLMERISPDEITATPINLGRGTVMCAHGEMEVPTPATANIIGILPAYKSEVKGELCTPTGAAIITYFAYVKEGDFSKLRTNPKQMAQMIKGAEKIDVGKGMGTKDFATANCLRAYLIEE